LAALETSTDVRYPAVFGGDADISSAITGQSRFVRQRGKEHEIKRHRVGGLVRHSFAPHTKASLNKLSKIMGLPGKPEGIDGAEVERYFLEGRIREIADYCETDVVNTYRVWLRYELFRGRLTESEHQVSERSLAEFIAARLNRAPHHRAPEVAAVREEGLHRASAPAGKASIDMWVADLLDTPEKTRAASLYELLLRLNLNVSHLDEAREAYVRRLGLR
jgi:Predicted 3'-5' exonuclease related to the exonuclease domain of PolB